MGREIRRVPADWEHPRDDRTGHFVPMFDKPYEPEAQQWLADCIAWANGTHEDQADRDPLAPTPAFFWEWDGGPPQPEWYRPAFDTEPTHYQFYETVSEGTPLSPVFATLAELEEWLVTEGGYSRDGAHAFCERGWAPSLVVSGGVVSNGIEGLAAS